MAIPPKLEMADESLTHSSGDLQKAPDLRLIHFNDVYHLEASSSEPVGGAARFQTLCNYYRSAPVFKGLPDLITLFSGDAFNPSLESSVTKGGHMVPVLNNIGTNVACVGNHDLDFGIPQFENLASKCSFPWLLANVLDPALGEGVPLGHAKKTVILESSNGIKIGVIGLVEEEWLATLNSVPPNLIFEPPSSVAQKLVPELRKDGAEIIVALTHQREPNDNRLAKELPEGTVDLILGGHDHYYQHSIINKIHILRSGTDFKQLSYIEARKEVNGSGWDFHIIRRDAVSSIEEDKLTLQLTEKLTSTFKAKLEKPLGFTATPLDARFTTVRLKESNIGNFVCDIMRSFYQCDCCIIAAGTIRGDQVYSPGVLKLKDIMNCFPFEDPCVVIQVTGNAIREALENAISKYPALEGRFPQVSNIEFEFDAALPPHARIEYVKIGGADLDPTKEYKLVTRDYMARGKDGFTSLLPVSDGGTAKVLVSEENGILISMLLRQYFTSLKILGRWRHWDSQMENHWNSVHAAVHSRHPVLKTSSSGNEPGSNSGLRPSEDDSDSDTPDTDEISHTGNGVVSEREQQIIKSVARKWWRLTGLPGHPQLCNDIPEEEFTVDWTRGIAPKIEGRIRMTSK